MSNKKIPQKWQEEKKAIKATQVAFDVGEKIQYVIRKEALDRNLNPPDRIRQILGLKVSRKPKRLRLSISLTAEDMKFLAKKFAIDEDDNIEIKRRAAEMLIKHARANDKINNSEDNK
ncbi:MAG: hypothetical protein JKY19_09040 [Alcanivoracaceae bacterium]|nr:hypothetical protein [Alcanivoracaceae bacterium]